jgi:hypothetical protein
MLIVGFIIILAQWHCVLHAFAFIFEVSTCEICDKQRSKVENLAKYVHLQEVGTFQIITSVTKY